MLKSHEVKYISKRLEEDWKLAKQLGVNHLNVIRIPGGKLSFIYFGDKQTYEFEKTVR